MPLSCARFRAGIELFGPGHFDAYALVDAAIFAAVAVGLWRYSRTAAILGLAFYLIERVYMWSQFGFHAVAMAVILTLAFVSGIRGTFSYHRLRSEARADSANPLRP